MPDKPIIHAYTDGGQAGWNPSYTGGAYGFRLVRHAFTDPVRDHADDEILFEQWLTLLPEQLGTPTVTNNNVEVAAMSMAANRAAQILQETGGTVVFCPDSLFALKTFSGRIDPTTVPAPLIEAMRIARDYMEVVGIVAEYELIKGHSDKIPGALEAGFVVNKNAPGGRRRVSRHNVAVDHGCTALCATIPIPSRDEVNARPGIGLFTVGDLDAGIVEARIPTLSGKTL